MFETIMWIVGVVAVLSFLVLHLDLFGWGAGRKRRLEEWRKEKNKKMEEAHDFYNNLAKLEWAPLLNLRRGIRCIGYSDSIHSCDLFLPSESTARCWKDIAETEILRRTRELLETGSVVEVEKVVSKYDLPDRALRLVAELPWSRAILEKGQSSGDPDVRRRCHHAFCHI